MQKINLLNLAEGVFLWTGLGLNYSENTFDKHLSLVYDLFNIKDAYIKRVTRFRLCLQNPK